MFGPVSSNRRASLSLILAKKEKNSMLLLASEEVGISPHALTRLPGAA